MRKGYDIIYIGAGIINCLDAADRHLNGDNVIVLEASSVIGGAWRSIDIFNNKGVENAVHYLIPHDNAYHFLEKILRVRLSTPAEGKFFSISIFKKHLLLSVKSFWARFIYELYSFPSTNKNIYKRLVNAWRAAKNSNVANSRYPLLGSEAIVSKIQSLILRLQLPIKYGSKVERVNISDGATVVTADTEYDAKKIRFGHGIKPPTFILSGDQQYVHARLNERRPSLHIGVNLSQGDEFNQYSQILFPSNAPLKYVHNLSQFQQKTDSTYLIIVAALRHDAVESLATFRSIYKYLSKRCLLPQRSDFSQVKFHWQEIFLPEISSYDLDAIRTASDGYIEPLLTEELSYALDKYSPDWMALSSWLIENGDADEKDYNFR